MSLQWQNPNAFWLLIGVSCLMGIMLWKAHRFPKSFSLHRFIIITFGFILGITALARPQWGQRVLSKQGLRSQVYLAIDISKSMLAEDILPSRLGFSITFCQRLLAQMTGARVALFPFALDGYLQMPLTTDLIAISDILGALNPNMTTAQGTDITVSLTSLLQHIERAEKLSEERGEDPLPTQVILISDGEHHPALSESVLRSYRSHRIPIFTVGTGTPSGSLIPGESRWGMTKETLKDSAGKNILTKLNADALKRISVETGGDYFPAKFESAHLIKQRLAQNMKYGKLTTNFRVEREYYPILFIIVFCLFLFEFFSNRWEYAIRGIAILGFLLGTPVFAQDEEPVEKKGSPERIATELYNEASGGSSKDLTKNMEQLQEALEMTRDPSLQKRILFNLGNAMLKAGDPVQALQTYQRAFDLKTSDSELERVANERISDNLVLAQRILEDQKKQPQSGEGNGGSGSPPSDPKGPQKNYKPQQFSDEQKQKIYDLLSNDEQQILQKLQAKRNQSGSPSRTDKPW